MKPLSKPVNEAAAEQAEKEQAAVKEMTEVNIDELFVEDDESTTPDSKEKMKVYTIAGDPFVVSCYRSENELNRETRHSELFRQRMRRGLCCALSLVIVLCLSGMILSLFGAIYLQQMRNKSADFPQDSYESSNYNGQLIDYDASPWRRDPSDPSGIEDESASEQLLIEDSWEKPSTVRPMLKSQSTFQETPTTSEMTTTKPTPIVTERPKLKTTTAAATTTTTTKVETTTKSMRDEFLNMLFSNTNHFFNNEKIDAENKLPVDEASSSEEKVIQPEEPRDYWALDGVRISARCTEAGVVVEGDLIVRCRKPPQIPGLVEVFGFLRRLLHIPEIRIQYD